MTVIKPGVCTDRLHIGGTLIDQSLQEAYKGSLLLSTSSSMEISLRSCARYSRTEASGFILNISYSGQFLSFLFYLYYPPG